MAFHGLAAVFGRFQTVGGSFQVESNQSYIVLIVIRQKNSRRERRVDRKGGNHGVFQRCGFGRSIGLVA